MKFYRRKIEIRGEKSGCLHDKINENVKLWGKHLKFEKDCRGTVKNLCAESLKKGAKSLGNKELVRGLTNPELAVIIRPSKRECVFKPEGVKRNADKKD
ncbi:hypothetical protein ACTNCH_11425 [Candidatus Merdisoma sp. HCP28S3_D10]|uniref:hypothetical protein n=1 Tax=unclassified Candidatus Merdisoma TaxID=3099611 RepID=UPI003F8B029F